MALQSSGAISLSDIAGEFGGSTPHSLSEYYGVASGVPSSGTISFNQFYGTSNTFSVQYLVVGGGGGGGAGDALGGSAGGGGAGGIVATGTINVAPGSVMSGTVGLRGNPGASGGTSSLTDDGSTIASCAGGGRGGSGSGTSPTSGGGGGGFGSGSSRSGGGNGSSASGGDGGGGGGTSNASGKNGGNGTNSSLLGSTVNYGGGGGGGSFSSPGSGGGSAGSGGTGTGSNGSTYQGSGGGGGGTGNGGYGGKGVVILRSSRRATARSNTSNVQEFQPSGSSDWVYLFKASGTVTYG